MEDVRIGNARFQWRRDEESDRRDAALSYHGVYRVRISTPQIGTGKVGVLLMCRAHLADGGTKAKSWSAVASSIL